MSIASPQGSILVFVARLEFPVHENLLRQAENPPYLHSLDLPDIG